MEMVVGGERVAAFEGIALAAGLAHIAARFAHEQQAGGNVPGAEPVLPVTVEPPGRNIGEVEGGRAHATDIAYLVHEAIQLAQIARPSVAALAIGRAGGDQGLAQLAPRGDPKPPVVEEGPDALLAPEQLVLDR